ncbi:MAG: Maf family protein [Thermodesulfobacteriota bacterium]|nr:Maf family protein [Thermodesulfobacteriota bacterium]
MPCLLVTLCLMNASFRTGALVLASNSPRRSALLNQAGLAFGVVPSSVDESQVTASLPESRVRLLAEAKAHEVSLRYPRSWVIGADTMVVIGNNVLGKPRTADEARHMLRSLSGKTHRVLTGYCICCNAAKQAFSDTVETKVLFKTLTEGEIDWYIDTAEPFDKAGGYGAQGLGAFLIRRLEGSYTSVVGLPVCEVVDYLVKKGVVKR